MRASPAGGGRAGGVLIVWLLWDRLYRAWIRPQPICEGGLLRCNRARHRGAPLELADGTVVHRGDQILALHFDSPALVARAQEDHPWRVVHALEAEARLLAHRPDLVGEAKALFGVTLFASLARHAGFEVRALPRTWSVGLLRFYFLGFLAIHHPRGWRGVPKPDAFWPGEAWLSVARLRSAT